MSETEEPPAKVLKIDNFDQELSIPEIEPIGNGSVIPDGIGDAASVIDGEIPNKEGSGEEADESIDNDLTEAEEKEANQFSIDSAQGTNKPDDDITDAAAKLINEIEQNIDQELDNNEQEADNNDREADNNDREADKIDQDAEKIRQDADKSSQDAEKLDSDLENVGQDANTTVQVVIKPDQDGDNPGQVPAAGQDASGSQEETEGQEEWLSEGILTDDDLNANASANTSEDDKPLPKLEEQEPRTVELNIEETLNHLDGSMEQEGGDEGVTDKSDTNTQIKQEQSSMNHEPDDGNDTDDLLRMLGEDDSKKSKKKLTKTVKDLRNALKNVMEGSDDEEFEYDETSIRKLKATKNAITKKTPPKAVPEDLDDGDDDDTDQSSDEALSTLKKSYNMKKTKITKKLVTPRQSENFVVVKKASTNKQHSTNDNSKKELSEKSVKKPASTVVKPSPRSILKTSTPAKMVASKPNPDKTRIEFKPPTNIKTQTPFRAESILKKMEMKKDEQNDEYLDEEDDFDDDFESDIEEEMKSHQRIMKPERMDEEMPSDGDSCDEDGSLYDEMPSSESDDMDDWFHIDIRAERASDYIPLLGAQAKQLLMEEKKRTSLRLGNLRQSLSALTETGKKQAEELRKATMTLAELDDMLKAS